MNIDCRSDFDFNCRTDHKRNCLLYTSGQTADTLYRDLLFIKELKPEMIGIGPFIPHKDTPFAKELPGKMCIRDRDSGV